jgi:16S rRNA (adenine1518-N6/adenine1519-N6)-dimethyltransferase
MDADNIPVDMALLLQREMADRLAAAPGTRTYGALSVRVRFRYHVTIVRQVPPQVFFPAPEVGSAYVRLRRRAPEPSTQLQKKVDRLAKRAFQQRRKKLIRVLAANAPHNRLKAIFEKLQIDENSRAEQLTPGNFADIATCLQAPETPYCKEGF